MLEMKLILRIVLVVSIGILIFLGLSRSNPCYTNDDLYLVNGYCSDIQYEDVLAKNGTERVYIVMDDGKRYYIYDSVWKRLDDNQKNMKGREVSFFASDKSKHWLYDHLIISLEADEDACTESIKFINKKHIETRVVILLTYCVVMSLFYLTPEILREIEKREHRNSTKKRN